MKKIYHLQLAFKLVLFFGLFSASSVSFADGSKDLYPSGIQGHRAMLSSSNAAPSASFPFPNQGIHYIYVQAGEIITLASNSQDISTTKRIYLYDPDGNDVTPALGAAGNIPNRAAELAGPAKPGTTPVGNQYVPLYYTAPATGIYQVSFRGGNSHASQAGLADGNWATGTNTTYVSAWDASVFKPSEDEFVGGRVWANVFNFAANSTSYRVYAQTYVLTKDGYIYRTSQNGMNGQLYTFFVNNNGVTDIDNKQSVYKSVSASTPAAIAALGYNIHNPNLEDTETDITHKMFYTLPASDLPTEAAGAVPGGTTWLKNTPILPDVQNLEIKGVDGTVGQVSNKGGYIGFTADAQGQYIVEITSDEIPAAFVTREIRGVASIGANEVFWDGEDGDGTPLPQGDVPATITVRMQGAEVHFPYFDVENNLDGILIERLDHSDLNTVLSDTVYWDDSEITTTSGAPSPKNNSHLPPTNSIGLRSSVNGHIFSSSYGDQKTLDTWTFIRGAAKTTSTNIVVNESDLEVVSIVSDLSDPVSVGAEWTYTSVIHNHGPSAVATNTDPGAGPITRGAVFRLYVPDGVTISTVLSDISFSGDAGVTIVGEPTFVNGFFEAIVDMPANSGATIALKASATSTVSTYEGTIYAWSTILRPNDYTDINATNPDILVPPTDPFFEADGIQAEYATIAGDDPTSIDLTQTNNIKLNGDLAMVADLSITKEVSSGPWQVHTPVTFTLTAVNNGPSNATGVVVTDLLPDGYLFVSADPSLGTYDESTGEWTIGDLPVDAGSNTATLTMVAEVQPTGVYSNVATISSDVFDDDLSNNEDETGVVSPEAAEADLVIEKSVDNDRPTVGAEVTFTITVTNNGPSRATDVVVNDVMANGYNVTGVTVEEGTWNAPDWTIPSLASGESFEMTITAEALASGTYDNTATVDANEDDPDESNNTDEVLVELADPSLSFVKTGVLSADGNTVTYTFRVENTGNVTMEGITVSDPKITGAITLDATELAPGDVATGTATYTVTQGEKDAGMVENLATATGTPPTTDPDNPATPITPVPSTPDPDNPGEPGEPGIPTEVEVPADPALSFAKTGVLSSDGNTVTYTFRVENTGNVTMEGITVSDPKITGAITLDATELAPGDVATGTATYTVTQGEKDAGMVENLATATGTPPTTNPDDPAEPIDPVPSTPDTDNPGTPGDPGIPTEVEVPADPALSFVKTGVLSADGNTVTYTFTVTNIGNVTMTGVSVTDPKITGAITLDATELAPGKVATGTATYTVTQGEKDAGMVENLATATGTPPTMDPDNPSDPIDPVPSTPDTDNPGTPSDPGIPTEVEVPSTPALELSKVATSEGPYAVDDYINYEITVRNTGNVTLTDVVVTDNNAEIVSGSPVASLAPNTTATVIARHQITQADIDAGIVVNQAKVTGDDPEGNPTPEVPSDNPDTPQPNDPTVVELTQRPGLSLTKRATGEGPYAPDDYIDFEIVVRNTGNVTLKDVTVTDNNAEITDGSPIASLAPNATATVIARHQVTQADIDAGIVVNQAKVTGDDPEGDSTPEVPSDNPDTPQPNDPTVVELTQRPGLSLTKRATGEGPYAVNDYINYEIVVRNKGNVTLTDVVVTDDNAEIVSGSPIASLAPNATATVIARHQITQADIDAGIVVNQAKVTGDDPEGNPTPEAPSDNPDTSQPNDPTVVELTQQPGLVLTKRTTGEGPYEVGDYIRFEIAVTNTGNVTLANVVVTDENAEIVAGAQIAGLAPNATSTVIARHQVTQADIDAGTVVNQAKVIGNDPDGNPIPEVPSDNPDTPQPNDPTVVELTNTSSLSLTKRATGEGPYAVGQYINYEITVRNTGNVTLTDVVVIDGNAEIMAGTPIASLKPNVSATVIARHRVTQADIDAGTVTNQATVTGNDPGGNPISEVPSDNPNTLEPNDPTVVPMESAPMLSLTKGVTSEGPYDVGDHIKYFNIVVTNTGNVTLTDVVVTDDNAEIIAGSPIARLRPGESASVMARHVVTQADVDAGEVINQARVSGNDPGGNRTPEFLSDDPNTPELGDQTITPIAQAPAIRIDKVANRQLVEKEGDRIGYQLQVINTGNVTLYDVEITDPLTGFVQQIARVKPGVINAHTFRTTYTTTAADLVVGKIVNTATVTASAPDGSEISHEASVEVEAYFKEIEAGNDDFGPVNGKTGGNAGNVFTNDKINGDPLVPGEVILTRVPSDDPSPLTLEEDGTVTIAPNTPAGTYSFDYRVCDVINPNNCSTATVTVVVAPAEIRATDDLVTGINGYEGTSNVANVFMNDQLNGTPIGPEDVTLTLIGGDPALRLNPDGSVDVLPGTRGGTYTLEYQICEKLNPDNCSVARVTITVVNPLKIPNVFTPNGDGKNDQFEIIGSEGFDRIEVTVVNRWGNEVYRNDDYQNDWSGQGLTEGTYYYLITTHLGSAREVHKGWVLIKRL